jgi:hypothetical protein
MDSWIRSEERLLRLEDEGFGPDRGLQTRSNYYVREGCLNKSPLRIAITLRVFHAGDLKSYYQRLVTVSIFRETSFPFWNSYTMASYSTPE